jgi:hypothetical protein
VFVLRGKRPDFSESMGKDGFIFLLVSLSLRYIKTIFLQPLGREHSCDVYNGCWVLCNKKGKKRSPCAIYIKQGIK